VLFPGINVAAMMWKEPAVLHLPLKHVAAQLVSLRWAMPSVDVRKIVEGEEESLTPWTAFLARHSAVHATSVSIKLTVQGPSLAEPHLIVFLPHEHVRPTKALEGTSPSWRALEARVCCT